jgi:hypothetical protein
MQVYIALIAEKLQALAKRVILSAVSVKSRLHSKLR